MHILSPLGPKRGKEKMFHWKGYRLSMKEWFDNKSKLKKSNKIVTTLLKLEEKRQSSNQDMIASSTLFIL